MTDALSIVYTTRDDPWLFPALDGLRRLDHAGLAVEAVVVLHRSPPDYTERVLAHVESSPKDNTVDITVAYLSSGATISAARNCGARLARHDTLLFLDSDCVIAPDALHGLRGQPVEVANGPVVFAPNGSWFSRHNCRLRDIGYRSLRERLPYMPNLLIDRNHFEKVGGFRAGLHRGEDFEFGDRLVMHGSRPRYLPGLRVTHLDDPRVGKTFKNWYRNGWGAGARRLIDRERPRRPLPPVLLTPQDRGRHGPGYAVVSTLGALFLALGQWTCLVSTRGRARPEWTAGNPVHEPAWRHHVGVPG